LLFLDGVGLGANDARSNPFAVAHTPNLTAVAGGRLLAGLAPRKEAQRTVRPLDATFGHPGLPQSATGQAALLSGEDAVALMEGPYGPWPGPRLQGLLARNSLFRDAWQLAGRAGALLANAYPESYQAALADPQGRHRRVRAPASVVAARAAGFPLCGVPAWVQGEAVAPDLQGGVGPLVGLPPSPEREGGRFAALAGDHLFTYLDVWITDSVGHQGELGSATALLERIDRFLGALLAALPARVTLVICADHGNFEDASGRRHTRSPVPLIAYGPCASAFQEGVDLRAVAVGVRRAWGLEADEQERLVPSPSEQEQGGRQQE
jgi:2,3-bisphosphoglycerate-independent phosphoglycerate mutase